MLYLFWLLIRPLPADRASAVGRQLFRWLGPRTTMQQHIKVNLALAFPGLRCTQLEMLARDIWGSFGSVLAGSI
jgi:lauroyl/myristoyl acyltransferase